MRLLLDAHLSPKRIAALATEGHDVMALATDVALRALEDRDVLAYAVAQKRILVTCNSRDFSPLLREWAEAGRAHHGCILIWTLRQSDFGSIISRIDRLLTDRPDGSDWLDLVVAI
ncbi:MAG: DUF5615 family PIN-like protein [Trueperaceae bacterium]|nr:DUF5615 family PIN-like protein [Trueperaceae bacterium]